jgi:hypothetical protein
MPKVQAPTVAPITSMSTISLRQIPRNLQIGPLAYCDWVKALIDYLPLAGRGESGPYTEYVFQRYKIRSVDGFLTMTKEKSNAIAHETQPDPTVGRSWSNYKANMMSTFNHYAASLESVLAKDPEMTAPKLFHHTSLFFALRLTEAKMRVDGLVSEAEIDSLNQYFAPLGIQITP